MPANARLRHLLVTPALLTGLLVSMTVATPAGAGESEPPVRYEVAQAVVLKRKPPRQVLPVSGYRLTAHFGATGYWSSAHTGLDFATAYGAPVRSITGGEVVESGYDGAYGIKTVIRAGDGTELWFCHQSRSTVSVGQTVEPGQLIGNVGLTGNTTGAHLHLEIRPVGGDPVDPYATLAKMGLRP